jgi:uracil-DNA glycosylase
MHRNAMTEQSTTSAALAAFRGAHPLHGWGGLPFLASGAADRVAAEVDARRAAGADVLPRPEETFAAFALAPLGAVRVVILGQDPYPTPGDAHGLAFSYRGGRRLPPSLRAILAEAHGSVPPVAAGDLGRWARQGVLLLNTALTVEAGKAGAHLGLGWDALAADAISAVSAGANPAAFLFWGAKAAALAPLVDAGRHRVLACGHPSPLNRHRDFAGCGHFAEANRFLAASGRDPVDWAGA